MSDAPFERLLIRQDGPVRTIEMNLPEQSNPFGFRMAAELDRAFKAANEDADTKVIILGSVGATFSGGHDLGPEGLTDYATLCPTPEAMWEECEETFFKKGGLDIWELDKPTIARVQGAAVAGSFALANVCDLIVAADDAFFWMPSPMMYGPGAEIFMEPWVMGSRRAKEFLFTNEKMPAEEAYRIGMVNRVVPRADLESATLELAQRIAKQPALGLKFAKRAINKTMEMQGFRQAMEYNFLLHVLSKATDAQQSKLWKPLFEKVMESGLTSYLKTREQP